MKLKSNSLHVLQAKGKTGKENGKASAAAMATTTAATAARKKDDDEKTKCCIKFINNPQSTLY